MKWFRFRGLFTTVVLIVLLISVSVTGATSEPFKLHVLDVGQGQAVLVEEDGHYSLIDGGSRASSSYVISYLKQQGVEKLDYLIASHYDEDHISGLIGALHVFSVDTILCPDYFSDTQIYESFIDSAETSGAIMIHPYSGEEYVSGDMDLLIVGPDNYKSDIENNRSIAVKISYGDVSVMVGGDAESKAEETMISSGLDLDADIYLANHHGSDTSSTDNFLNAVTPVYTIISCGKGNAYGHPTEAALERIQNAGSFLYRTDIQGEIIMYSNGQEYWFDQEPCDDWNSGDADSGAEGSVLTAVPGTEEKELSYIGNKNTYKFHHPECKSVSQMKDKNKVYLSGTRDEVIGMGYEPCQNCNP